jgi:hypothetical protein
MNLHESDLTGHIQNNSHRKLVLALASKGYCLESALSRRTAKVTLENRFAKLEHTKWQLCVKGLLFDYFSTGDYNTLNKVEISLNNYEHRGRLSLLELAVWKAASISYAGHVQVDSKISILSQCTMPSCVQQSIRIPGRSIGQNAGIECDRNHRRTRSLFPRQTVRGRHRRLVTALAICDIHSCGMARLCVVLSLFQQKGISVKPIDSIVSCFLS